MRATTDDRLRSAVLGAVAVAVLAGGGGWWHAAAPTPTATPAGPSTAVPTVGPAGPPGSAPRFGTTVGPREPAPLERTLVTPVVPGERFTIRVDDADEIVSVPRGFWAEIDPETGMIADIDGDPGMLLFQGGLLPFRETVWRERAALAPGERIVRQSAEGGARLLLQYRCTRPGSLTVTVVGAGLAGPSEIDCDGTVASARVLSHGRPFRVVLSATGGREVDVEAQLVELPR
ncbi:hypothetical protein O7631_03300 [Micromonospora sp. WMMD967]|uniref:hypothetical protein n=1 Tax=Micromonospora sp. WMMD967 TaxID=3016101 RepID=UPI0024170AF7|nr:hypothetical protein [Micromonospora sp. WMMD967]MDG4835543.1 hypothetical protein [Micromonospora sp. WMMD967]